MPAKRRNFLLGAHESGYSAVCSEREVPCVFANAGSSLCVPRWKSPVCRLPGLCCVFRGGSSLCYRKRWFPVYYEREVPCAPRIGKFPVYSQMSEVLCVPGARTFLCIPRWKFSVPSEAGSFLCIREYWKFSVRSEVEASCVSTAWTFLCIREYWKFAVYFEREESSVCPRSGEFFTGCSERLEVLCVRESVKSSVCPRSGEFFRALRRLSAKRRIFPCL